ncbi:BolA/IbaG family iron-sulfur metabolism protein [Pasteurellaceae bacterium TAE3-ERU1]|uniref:BolA family protein n=1 Tax=Spirabiliibacterium mucosae TaxID=28156 RepID=UPI001AAC9772|nr:BolA/IbaG family iron-sulfur metabolism protein [Spirabiliibacterium mucosae]MBE2898893.1 BolA/IbaG family iron-sulfur metabolism protein [Spirabiliibacterium mucosae]MBV7388154.1 BolA/IbaG family iron-sulfur metabolism protein [Pasteurellaceae bacterium TAE3-ERU1]
MNQQQIEAILHAEFAPHFLSVENESHLHSSGKGADSHFRIVLVSDAFDGKRAVARHQLVYQALNQGNNGVHALALHTFTAQEWAERDEVIASPRCAGHGK